jgi:putative Ca2+/H+ antiporter (TMEM165/GDT1 family)
MEALLSALLAAALAELGDRSQWLALALALHFRRDGAVLAGIALAAIANAAISAVAGTMVAPIMPREGATLMLALALASAAFTLAMRTKAPPALDSWRIGAFGSSFALFFVTGLGDKTQFLTFAIAARTGMPVLTAMGAALGVIAMSMAAVIGGRSLLNIFSARALRLGAAALMALLASIAAVNALRLI